MEEEIWTLSTPRHINSNTPRTTSNTSITRDAIRSDLGVTSSFKNFEIGKYCTTNILQYGGEALHKILRYQIYTCINSYFQEYWILIKLNSNVAVSLEIMTPVKFHLFVLATENDIVANC